MLILVFKGTLHDRGRSRVVKLTVQLVIEHSGLIAGLIALHFATVQTGDDDGVDDPFLEPLTATGRIFTAGSCAAVIAWLGSLVLVGMRGEFGGANKVVGGDDLLGVGIADLLSALA